MTLLEIADALRARLKTRRLPQVDLARHAGIAIRTLTHVLSGKDDFKVSTLLSVADRLDMVVMVVPKEVAAGIGAPSQPTAPGRTLVGTLLPSPIWGTPEEMAEADPSRRGPSRGPQS